MIRKPDTKAILAESLHELALVKPVDKITIKEIVENCQTTPPTFYRHFKTKYDLIAWVYDSKVQEATDGFGRNYDWLETVRQFIRFMAEDRDYYLNVLRNTSGRDEFHALSRNNDIAIIKNRLREINEIEAFDEETDFGL